MNQRQVTEKNRVDLANQSGQLKVIRQQVIEQNKMLNSVVSERRNVEEYIKKMYSELETRESRLAGKEAQLRTMSESLSTRSRDLTEREDLHTLLAREREGQLSEFEDYLNRRAARIDEKERNIAKKILDLENEVTKCSIRLKSIEDEVSVAEAHETSLRAILAQLEHTINTRQQELAEVNTEIAFAESEIGRLKVVNQQVIDSEKERYKLLEEREKQAEVALRDAEILRRRAFNLRNKQ